MTEASRIPVFKPSRITGNHLCFRNAQIEDAAFIVTLRTHPEKSKYLSATSTDVEQQAKWLEGYAGDDTQVYFIICERDGRPIGTVRIYDCLGDSFCWGSWVLAPGANLSASIESVLIVYKFALELGFRESHFEVRPENRSVLRFHERFGAARVKETKQSIHYRISHDMILESQQRYREFLPKGIEVVW